MGLDKAAYLFDKQIMATRKKTPKIRRKPKPLPHGSRTRSVSETLLKRLIKEGARPGDRLPTEHELAKDFGVSRPTARQALQALTYAGLIEARTRRGTVLKEPDMSALGPFFGAHLALAATSASKASKPEDALALMAEARVLMECSLLNLIVERRTPADLEAMEQAERMMAKASAGDRKKLIEADAAFHHALIHAAHNPVLQGVSQLVQGYFDFFEELFPADSPKMPHIQRTLNEHQRLRNAIKKRNLKEAEKILSTHLSPVRTVAKLKAANQSKSRIKNKP